MSHFKASNLERDVVPIIHEWQKAGAELCLSREEFQRTFDVVVESDAQFECFDTNKNGRVDAYEILVVYILLSTGEKAMKLQTAFDVFSFSNGTQQGPCPAINFDEAMIMLSSCVRGVSKVCLDAIKIQDAEVLFLCQSMFDMHRISYTKRIQRAEFKDWVRSDPHPLSFVEAFHNSQSLSDVKAQLLKWDREQGAVFKTLCHGSPTVRAEDLLNSAAFARALENSTSEEVAAIVNLMTDNGKEQHISVEKYHATLRTFNIFLECDLDKSGFLDEKELDILLWIQMRTRPSSDFVKSFLDYIDCNADGQVSRLEWVTCVTKNRIQGASAGSNIMQIAYPTGATMTF